MNSGKILILGLVLTTTYALARADDYDRGEWGSWKATGESCGERSRRSTREQMLVDHSKKDALKYQSDRKCKVRAGSWLDQATGERFTEPRKLDLDHVVAVGFAASHGGNDWSRDRKARFYNDRSNLWLISASANRSKGDKPPWKWLPPREKTRCWYVRRFENGVRLYQLQLSDDERSALNRIRTKVCRS